MNRAQFGRHQLPNPWSGTFSQKSQTMYGKFIEEAELRKSATLSRISSTAIVQTVSGKFSIVSAKWVPEDFQKLKSANPHIAMFADEVNL